jgi:hypothetical protein
MGLHCLGSHVRCYLFCHDPVCHNRNHYLAQEKETIQAWLVVPAGRNTYTPHGYLCLCTLEIVTLPKTFSDHSSNMGLPLAPIQGEIRKQRLGMVYNV